MPKAKTKSSVKKRFKITATGKIMRAKGMKSHFRRRKAPRVKRQFDRMLVVDSTNAGAIEKLLPYGS